MRDAALSVRLLTLAAVGLTASAFGVSGARAQSQPQPGHAIADKFAKEADKPDKEALKRAADAKRKAEAEKKKRDETRRKADEADMLGTARIEAEARRAELEKARAETEAAEEKLIAEAQAAETAKRLDAERGAEAERRIAAAKAAEETRITAALEAQRIQLDAQRMQEAAERRAAEAANRLAEARAAEARRIAETQAAEAARKVAEAQARAEEERRITDAFAAARAKEDERRAVAEIQRIAETKAAEDARVRAEIEAGERRRIADAKTADDVARKAETARQLAMAAEREAETARVAERLREVRIARQALEAAPVPTSLPVQSSQDTADRGGLAQATPGYGLHSAAPPERVTVLMRLEPGNRGIRRHNKTADPLLCNGQGCYVSNGAAAPAGFLSGRRALGFGRTFGARAGACSNQLGCVFRDVDYASIAGLVQPVDMRVMRHDRREARAIDGVSECVATKLQLTCRRTIETDSYVLWIVPEALAETVGPAVLEQALADGLPRSEQAALR